jgi:hypothetical protein
MTTPYPSLNGEFGSSVGMYKFDDHLLQIIGSPRENNGSSDNEQGAAHIFLYDIEGETQNYLATISGSDSSTGDWLGFMVAVYERYLIFAAVNYDADAANQGAVYTYYVDSCDFPTPTPTPTPPPTGACCPRFDECSLLSETACGSTAYGNSFIGDETICTDCPGSVTIEHCKAAACTDCSETETNLNDYDTCLQGPSDDHPYITIAGANCEEEIFVQAWSNAQCTMPIGSPYSIPIETCYGNLKVTSCGASTSNAMATGTIVAIVLGSFFGLLILILICFYMSRTNDPRYTQQPVEMRPYRRR